MNIAPITRMIRTTIPAIKRFLGTPAISITYLARCRVLEVLNLIMRLSTI
jgi:hypothetical protein